MLNTKLIKRILDISYRNKLCHIGSCIGASWIIEEIFNTKKPTDKFVLSSGHAALALYAVMEQHDHIDAEQMLLDSGVHPDRLTSNAIDCSTGSLGQGLPIAIGMALADITKDVYCLISDGECGEGSIWESLRIIDELKLHNLKVYVNMNGFGGYKELDTSSLYNRLLSFMPSIRVLTTVGELPHLKGLMAHYKILNEQECQDILKVLNEAH